MRSNVVLNKLESLFLRHNGVSSNKTTETYSLVENFSEILSDTSQKILKIMKQKNRNKNKNS